jgi:hypothetical protein
MLSADLTEGMTTIEKVIVLLAACASLPELENLLAFFDTYVEARRNGEC